MVSKLPESLAAGLRRLEGDICLLGRLHGRCYVRSLGVQFLEDSKMPPSIPNVLNCSVFFNGI